MSKFGFYGKFTAHSGKRDEFVQILLEAAASMQTVDGCELYIVNVTDDDPDTVWVTEVWRDAEAHKASLENEDAKALIHRARPMIAGVEQIKLRTLGGKGLK